jgi:hypothetical protein
VDAPAGTASSPPPTVSPAGVFGLGAVSPPSGSTRGGDAVTISGTNIPAGASVLFDGEAANVTSDLAPHTLVVVTPAHVAGQATVTVTAPDGTSQSLPDAFTYLALPAGANTGPASPETSGAPGGSIVGTAGTDAGTTTADTTAPMDGTSPILGAPVPDDPTTPTTTAPVTGTPATTTSEAGPGTGSAQPTPPGASPGVVGDRLDRNTPLGRMAAAMWPSLNCTSAVCAGVSIR